MNIKLILGLLTLGLSVITPLQSRGAEEELIFTYDYEGAEHAAVGIQRLVQTDAAMLIKDASFVGFDILGVSVDIPSLEGCSCDPIASAWLTRELKVVGEYNLPDVEQVNGLIKNYGTEENPELRLDLTFPEPYKLTEEGIYVGYSLNVTSCKTVNGWTSKYPIVTVCDVNKPESFMIHCTKGSSTLPQKYANWTDLGVSRQEALAMRVILRGDIKENAASLMPEQTLYSAPGEEGYVFTTLTNHGTSPVSSIEYSYILPDDNGESTVMTHEFKVDPPLSGKIGAFTTIDIPFVAPEKVGNYELDLKVIKVNGMDNSHSGESTLKIDVVPFLPVHRPLIEDYASFSCGYCPAVYVAIKQMYDKYPDNFLAISYHIDDYLQVLTMDRFPSQSINMPEVYMENRQANINLNNMEYLWVREQRNLAPADIDVNIYWNDAEKTSVRAESDVKFVYDNADADYALAYSLIEDGMSNSSWSQENQYFMSDFTSPYWDLFCGKGYLVKGLVYDDIVVNFPAPLGIEGSLPTIIESGKVYSHYDNLIPADALNVYKMSSSYGKNVIIDPDKLRVVAMLIDKKTGRVCNAVTSGYTKDAPVYDPNAVGIDEIEGENVESDIAEINYYSLDGIRLDKLPENGVVIIVTKLKDGSVSTAKRLQ